MSASLEGMLQIARYSVASKHLLSSPVWPSDRRSTKMWKITWHASFRANLAPGMLGYHGQSTGVILLPTLSLSKAVHLQTAPKKPFQVWNRQHCCFSLEEQLQVLQQRDAIFDELKLHLPQSQESMQFKKNQKIRDVQFGPGDMVYLKL